MTNDELNPNAERFRSLSFLRHSSFGFRHLDLIHVALVALLVF
jgi:hypothetical protein